jgi:hypothetical protein
MSLQKKLHKVRAFLTSYPRRIELLLLVGLSVGLSFLLGATVNPQRQQVKTLAQAQDACRQISPDELACQYNTQPVPPDGCSYKVEYCATAGNSNPNPNYDLCVYKLVCSGATPPPTVIVPTFGCIGGVPCSSPPPTQVPPTGVAPTVSPQAPTSVPSGQPTPAPLPGNPADQLLQMVQQLIQQLLTLIQQLLGGSAKPAP